MALADVALCPLVSFRRGSWIVSRVVLPCGPGCQTTMSHGSTHGLIREHTRWRPDLSTCTVVFGRGPMVPSVTTALGVSVPTFWLSTQTPRCTVGKHPSRACPARESAPHGLSHYSESMHRCLGHIPLVRSWLCRRGAVDHSHLSGWSSSTTTCRGCAGPTV